MKIKIPSKLSRAAFKALDTVKHHSPELLVGAGIITGIGGAVVACKATLKVDEILEERKETVEKIHTCLEDSSYDYNEEDAKKDLAITYVQTGVKLVKLYAPAVGLGILSVGMIISGHKILKKRNLALAAAYMAVDKSFKDYRGNVIERFGEEIDKELRYNIKAKEFEVETEDENGNKVISKEVVNVVGGPSEYAKFFDESNPYYRKDPEYNLMFLRKQQNYANDVLRTKGRLYLNEVYNMVGIPETEAGQIVGWIYDEKDPYVETPDGERIPIDNYVDFGIYDINRESTRAFVNGYEKAILLDFNCDGVIYNLKKCYRTA